MSTLALAAPVPPVWKPDPKLVPKLGPETTVGSYRLRPPKGYSYQKGPARDGATAHAWLAPPRADGSRSYLMLLTLTVPKSEAVPTPDQALEKLIGGIQRLRANDWKRSKKEHGTINGKRFVRARWSGTESRTGKRMHGILYVTVDGRTVVQLSSQDLEPGHESPLALAEAAARTFRVASLGGK